MSLPSEYVEHRNGLEVRCVFRQLQEDRDVARAHDDQDTIRIRGPDPFKGAEDSEIAAVPAGSPIGACVISPAAYLELCDQVAAQILPELLGRIQIPKMIEQGLPGLECVFPDV